MLNEDNDTVVKMHNRNRTSRAFMASAITMGLLVLGGCGGGSEVQPAATDQSALRGDDTAQQTPETDPLNNPGGSPSSVAAFEATLYPLLTGQSNCGVCHADNGIGTPTFASSSVEFAHQQLVETQRVDLVDPERSRLFLRLVEDKHNCWSGAANCDADGEVMLAAIREWAALVGDAPPAFNPLALSSSATAFSMATTQEVDIRVNDGLIAFYNFQGSDTTVMDISGVAPALNLELQGDVTRIEGGGLSFEGGRALGNAANSQKLHARITAAENMSYTVEMWVKTDDETQTGPARIINYSVNNNNRNFGLNQQNGNYHFRGRNTELNNNGNAPLTAGGVDSGRMQHVVATFDPTNGRSIYVDGVLDANMDDDDRIGDLSNWNANYRLVFGSEVNGNSPWSGDLFMVAVYEKSLTPQEISANFAAGLNGAKTYLSFDISNVVNTPETSIRFEAADFDDAAYLFSAPTVISPNGASFDLSGMRIAVNDRISAIGQTFADLKTSVNGTEVQLTRLGAIIPKGNGAEVDQIRLVFDEIAGQSNIDVPSAPVEVPLIDEPIEAPIVGMKTFDRMYATMAAVTGIDATTPELLSLYQEFRASLPSNPDPAAFSGATQTVVGKLALEFCNAWVEEGLAQTLLTDVDLSQNPSNVFGNGGADEIAQVLATHFFTGSLSGEPLAQATTELSNLLDAFIDTNNTSNAIKAVCQASTASAAIMMQ